MSKIYNSNLVYEILLVLSSNLQRFQMFHKPFSYHRLQFIPSLLPFQTQQLYATLESAALPFHRPKHTMTGT